MIIRETITLKKESTSTGQPIEAVLYGPEEGPSRATVFLIHGMSEHAARYLPLAEYLAAEGISTLLFDLPGHGKAAEKSGRLGYFAEIKGALCVRLDLSALSVSVREKLMPGERLILLGHSMGSILARLLPLSHRATFDAVILSGTMGKNKAAGIARWLASASSILQNPRHVSNFFEKVSQKNYLDKIESPTSKNDWLSRDKKIVSDYDADPLCGFPFTVSGWRDLLIWMNEISHQSSIAKLPRKIPYYVFSGTDDPVGGFGRGVDAFVKILRETGHLVSYRLYEGGRHEMLNEINREEVYSDLLSFLSTVINNEQA